MRTPQNVMTNEQAAEYLHVKPSTLRAMVREHRIPYNRLGERMVVFFREMLDLWLIMTTQGPRASDLTEVALRSRRSIELPPGLPTGRPLSKAEKAMVAQSRKDIAAGRVRLIVGR